MTKPTWTQCRACGAWHKASPSGGDFCEFCLRKGRSDWTVRTQPRETSEMVEVKR